MKYYNILDKNGQILIEGEFERINLFLSSKNTPLIKVQSNEKEKIIDLNGSNIIDNNYDEISDLEKGESINYYIVKEKDKFGYIKEDGSKITETLFNELSSYHNKSFEDGLAFVIEKGKKKFIKEDGRELMEIETSCGYGFKNGLALLKNNSLFGYINTLGNEISGFIYNDAYSFTKEGLGIVSKNRKWGIIDKKGEILLDFVYDKITNYLVSNPKNQTTKFILKVMIENLYGFIDLENNIYSKCEFKEIETKYMDDGYLLAKKDKYWGLLNFNAKEEITFIYEDIKILNKLIFAKKGKKIEITNTINKDHFIYKCEKYYLFKDVYIIKTKDNYLIFEFGGVNKFELNVDIIDDISNFYDGKVLGIQNNKYGVIDINGKIIIDFTYDEIKLEFDESNLPIYIVSKNGLTGVISYNNKILIEIKYESIILRHNIFKARNNKMDEIIDINGKLMKDTKYENLTFCPLNNQLYMVGYYYKGMKVSKSTYMVAREEKNSKNCRIIILSKSADDHLYIVAIGYAGGGVWGEIMAKISTTNNWDTSKGVFTNYLYDKNWKYKYDEDICGEFNESIDEIDTSIFKQLEEELFSKYVYYDDEDDEVADIPLLKKEFKASLKAKTFDSTRSTSIYKNLSKHWGLSYKW